MDSLIPQEKSAAVARGLREAFGVSEFDDIRPLTGGNGTVLVFRIVVGGTPYLLRVITRKDDPARHFECMKTAADGGMAPVVRYTCVEDKICITDFVEAVPFTLADALIPLAATLREVHALPPFPGAPNHINTSCTFLLNPGPAVDSVVQSFRAADLLPQAALDEVLALHAQLVGAYRREEADLVSSHNDLKPENILFDGRRVWLIDWEAAFRNDRYSDLAVIANYVVTNEAEEEVYLREYFGGAPDERQRARFFLMRQVSHLFYAMAYLLLGSGWRPYRALGDPGEPGKMTGAAPDFADFHRRLWAGGVDLKDNQVKTAYGRVHLERLFENARQRRFQEALRIVSR
jgi:aminoglycoside phosphotransferase (APT) family kinase protein